MTHRRSSIDSSTRNALYWWADCKRQVYATLSSWKPQSVIGKLMEEGPGVSRSGKPGQRWDELYTGDALVVQRIVSAISGTPRLVLTCYYVIGDRATVREQCMAMGISRAQYWPGLHAGEVAVSTGLTLIGERGPIEKRSVRAILKAAGAALAEAETEVLESADRPDGSSPTKNGKP